MKNDNDDSEIDHAVHAVALERNEILHALDSYLRDLPLPASGEDVLEVDRCVRHTSANAPPSSSKTTLQSAIHRNIRAQGNTVCSSAACKFDTHSQLNRFCDT